MLRAPGAFARDYFLKRYPIEFGGRTGMATRATGVDFLQPEFPIDVVYTWVDDRDPNWRARRASLEVPDPLGLQDPAHPARFRNRNELRYSLRSLAEYAPWVRKVFVVTAGQRPAWLGRGDPRVHLVDHLDLIDAEFLPTFNSHVIEAHLHRIPGLAEHYVYFNDDVFLSRPHEPSDFFLANGCARVPVAARPLARRAPRTAMDCASQNVRRLIADEYGVAFERHVLHAYHPQRRSAAARCEQLLDKHGIDFRDQRFRSPRDFNVATLMVHMVAYVEGLAVPSEASCMYFNIHSASATFCYQAMLDTKGTPRCPDSMCCNDTVFHADGGRELVRFLERFFPRPCAAETVSRPTAANSQMHPAAQRVP